MQMSGEQRIAALRQKVWEALNDPDVLKQCIPGCQSLEKEADDRFKATVAIKVGPIGARFLGAVTLSDLDPPNGYTITGEGQGGAAGSAKGGAKIKLADDGGGTLLTYDVDAQVGGKMAQLGGAIIDATAKNLAGQFFTKFGNVVAPDAGGPKPAAKPAATASSANTASSAQAAASAPESAKPASVTQPDMKPLIVAVIIAALFGFLIGRHSGGGWGGDYLGASSGLLILVVAAAAFEFGRRAAAPVIMLDRDLLARVTALVSEKKP